MHEKNHREDSIKPPSFQSIINRSLMRRFLRGRHPHSIKNSGCKVHLLALYSEPGAMASLTNDSRPVRAVAGG
jgi:hypothetical protein